MARPPSSPASRPVRSRANFPVPGSDEAREDLKKAQAEIKATPDAPQSVDP